MRGTLREKRPGYWEVRADAGVDKLTGRRARITRGVRGSRRDAERVLNALVTKSESGTVGGSSMATFGSLLDAWYEHASGELAYQTADRYRRILDKQILPVLGTTKLRKLDAATLDLYYRSLSKSGLAPATVRQTHAIIRSALNQGVKWEWIPQNVAMKATPPKQREAVTTAPTLVDVATLIERARQSRYPELGLLLHLGVVTGARRGELCGLRWSDLDLATDELVIARSVYATKDGTVVTKTTKTHQARRIALDRATVEALTEHHESLTYRARQCGAQLDTEAFIFTADVVGIEAWKPNRVTLAFRRLCAESGITGVRFHDLRHFAATHLLSAGVDVRTVSGRLGHANASTTLDIYSHFVNASDKHAATILGALVPK